jgi:FkbM family methyltransferase
MVYPLRFREWLYYQYVSKGNVFPAEEFAAASLAFAPSARLKLVPTDYSHRCIAMTGFYELDLTRFVAGLARKGGLFIDAGANFGYFTCLWAALNPANRVIAFEPSPQCIGPLRKNVSTNIFSAQVDIREAALGAENGDAWFDVYAGDQTGWGGLSKEEGAGRIRVPVRRLDDLLQDTPEPIEALKIDTEGADALVLRGAERLLKAKCIRNVFFEVNEGRMGMLGVAKDEPHRYLESCGYRVRHLNNDQWYAFPGGYNG